MIDDDDEAVRRFRAGTWRKADAIVAWVRAATTVLVHIEGKRIPKPVGNAVLLRVADSYFFLTAKHVFDEFGELTINVASSAKWAPLQGRRYFTMPDENHVDRLDAGVIDVDPDFVTDEMRVVAVGIDAVDRAGPCRSNALLMLGFPASRFENVNGRVVTPKFVQWAGTAFREQDLASHGHVPERHTALDFLPEEAVDDVGRRRPGPKMSGASGCGMWILPPGEDQTIDGLGAKLRAIFTHQLPLRRPSYLLGTQVEVYLAIIARHRPDLEGFIRP